MDSEVEICYNTLRCILQKLQNKLLINDKLVLNQGIAIDESRYARGGVLMMSGC